VGKVARAVADWWDAVELWLTQLAFPFQVLIAVLVLLPACWGAAALIDRLWELVAVRGTTRRATDGDDAGSLRH
jgi:hypothetical protein